MRVGSDQIARRRKPSDDCSVSSLDTEEMEDNLVYEMEFPKEEIKEQKVLIAEKALACIDDII